MIMEKKIFTISVPFTATERARFDKFFARRQELKKGAVVRQLILAHLDREDPKS